MRASIFISFFIMIFLTPYSAWSAGEDCVNCGNALSGKPELGSLERIAFQIDCSYFESSLCRIWDELDNAQEFHHFIKACRSTKSPLEVLRDTQCDSSSRSKVYRKQYLLHLLVSERGTFATIFMDLAKHFRSEGKTDDFAGLLNVTDERGLAFLDYLDETYSATNSQQLSNLTQGEIDRIKRYACLYGGRYATRSQPSDCKKSKNL
jgi:hypothetical protein